MPRELKSRYELQDSFFERGMILCNSGFDNCPGSIEIVVCQPMSHTGCVGLLYIWPVGHELGIQ